MHGVHRSPSASSSELPLGTWGITDDVSDDASKHPLTDSPPSPARVAKMALIVAIQYVSGTANTLPARHAEIWHRGFRGSDTTDAATIATITILSGHSFLPQVAFATTMSDCRRKLALLPQQTGVSAETPLEEWFFPRWGRTEPR